MVILGGMILFPFNIKYKIRDQGPEKKIFFFFFACLERGKFLLTKKKNNNKIRTSSAEKHTLGLEVKKLLRGKPELPQAQKRHKHHTQNIS